jgi:outer membrane receptor protein involved in Fe transport
MYRIVIWMAIMAWIFGAAPAGAAEKEMDEVLVETERLVTDQGKITIKPEGLPANVNVITREDVKKTPYTGDYLDLFRNIPGVQIRRFAGDLIPTGVGMRGFGGGHGTNQAYFVDGVPINFTTSSYGTDLMWLIPEIIERIEVIKGPFSALYGDQALAGVVNIVTKRSDPSPSLAAYGGSWGTARAVGTFSNPTWKVIPFMVWEGYSREGYRDNSQLRRANLFNKFTFQLEPGYLSFRFHYVARKGGMLGYMLLDDVRAGGSTRDSLNRSDGGNDEMFDAVITYTPKAGEAGFHGTLFYSNNSHDEGRTSTSGRPSTPGPQSRWKGRTNYWGWKLLYNFQPSDKFSLIFGNDMRVDDIALNTMTTRGFNTILAMSREYSVRQLGNGFFAQGQYKPFPFLKVVGGLRYDFYNINVDNRLNTDNNGVATPDVLSPKIGVVLTPFKNNTAFKDIDLNIFANYAQGFRSPRFTEISPVTGQPAFDLGAAKIDCFDVGFNAMLFKRASLAFSYYNTKLQRELVWNPTLLIYENLGNSVRDGVEVEARFFLTKELSLYGTYNYVRARLLNPTTPGAVFISNLSPVYYTIGTDFNQAWGNDHRVGLNFYWVHYSRAPANTRGSVTGYPINHLYWKLMYGYKKWTASVNVVYTPDAYPTDYWGASAATNRLQYDPWSRWDVLAGLQYQF